MAYVAPVAKVLAKLPIWGWAVRDMRNRLSGMGLQYEDLYIETYEVEAALARLTPDEYEQRRRRLRRALDLSLKHEHLDTEGRPSPFIPYLLPHLMDVERLHQERLDLGMH